MTDVIVPVERFESLVNYDGRKTNVIYNIFCVVFESLVNYDGRKTFMNNCDSYAPFESLVNYDKY